MDDGSTGSGEAQRQADRIPAALIALVWLPFACGYFLSYFYRSVNAMISPDLVRDLDVNPAQLGLLTSAYFLGFALFQLPLGVLLDRFGPRRVNALLLVVAAAGALLFSLAQSLAGLVAARALIGVGVSACLMAAIKASVQWFPMSRLATLNGWIFATGGLGAIASTAPVEAALRITDWRGVFIAIALATLAVAALVFLVVPERRDAANRESAAQLLHGMKSIYSDRVFWRLAPLALIMSGAFMAIQGLWVGPWLRDVAQLARGEVAAALLWLSVANMAGFALQGVVADRLAARGIDPLQVFKWTVGLSIALFALIVAGLRSPWAMGAYFLIGSGAALLYTILSQRFERRLAGRVNTAANLLVFAGAFGAQWAIGAVINLWPVAKNGEYAQAGYGAAFALMLVLQLIAFAGVLGLRPAPKS